MDLNKVMIIGRLTHDPEVRTTPQGTSVATLSVATNYVWTDANQQKQERVEYHNIVIWRKLAEIAGQYLKKGAKAYFEGRLQTRDWEGQDGIKRYRTEIIADNMIMLDRAGTGSSGPYVPPASNNRPAEHETTEIPTAPNNIPADDEIKIENIPF